MFLFHQQAKYFSRKQLPKETILPYTNINNNIKYQPLEDTTLLNGKKAFSSNGTGMPNGGTAGYFQNGGSSSVSNGNLLLSNTNGTPNKMLFV